jgi:hypothetical protein
MSLSEQVAFFFNNKTYFYSFLAAVAILLALYFGPKLYKYYFTSPTEQYVETSSPEEEQTAESFAEEESEENFDTTSSIPSSSEGGPDGQNIEVELTNSSH